MSLILQAPWLRRRAPFHVVVTREDRKAIDRDQLVADKVDARGEALTGPTTLPGQRVQTHNPPGCETGPNGVATWGKSTTDKVDVFGFKWSHVGQSSKHIPFDWTGPG